METSIPLAVPNLYVGIAVLFLCILLIAFLSSSEAALISVNKIRMREKAESGSTVAQLVLTLVEKHDKLFGTILLTENLVIIFSSSFATAIALSLFGQKGIAIATLGITLLVVMFGEITPKTFAARNSERMAPVVARPIAVVTFIATPFVFLITLITNQVIRFAEWIIGRKGDRRITLPYVTEGELKMLVDVGEEEGVLEKDEREMIHGIFEFKDTIAREIMTPRTDMITFPNTTGVDQIVRIAIESGHSRFPVYDSNADNVIGLLYIKDLLPFFNQPAAQQLPVSYIRPIHFVPENKKIDEIFRELKKAKTQMAIVVDEYGGTAGLITLEDILEEIVGEIQDEYDTEEELPVRHFPDGTYLVDSKVDIGEVEELLQIEFPKEDYDTLGGFVMGQLGKIPSAGEGFIFSNIKFTVRDASKRRIGKIHIEKLPQPTEHPEEKG